LSLSEVDILEGKLDDAQRRLKEVLAADPTNVDARLWMGNLGSMRGNYQNALENFRSVVVTDPNNPQALNNLAYLMVENGSQLTEALKYAQRAKELAPDTPEYADTLGCVLYHQGLYPLAVREFESATSKQANPVWEYHLAMAYAKAGNANHSRALLETALKHNPTLPEAKLAQQIVDTAAKTENGR
jgi:tetratricopeptide (TPR) repeat protein